MERILVNSAIRHIGSGRSSTRSSPFKSGYFEPPVTKALRTFFPLEVTQAAKERGIAPQLATLETSCGPGFLVLPGPGIGLTVDAEKNQEPRYNPAAIDSFSVTNLARKIRFETGSSPTTSTLTT